MRFPVSATGSKEDFERDWKIDQSFENQTTYGFHEGVDINLKTGGDTDLGQEVKAIANGRIFYYHYASHPTTGFGRHLVYRIDGAWGTRWVHCCHLTEQDFKSGVQDITEGSIIGRLGKSGTTYAHLHFAIYKVDPVGFGIDNYANNQTELDQMWEDPIIFINKWMQPTTPELIITDQTKIPQINDWEVQKIRSTLSDQTSTITNLQSKIDKIKTILAG